VPIPYVNIARDADLQNGSQTVDISGNHVALAKSNLGTSTGNEPGTAGGGLVSSKIKGKLTWTSSSLDVKIEGEGVVRFMDVGLHNGNKSNTTGANGGSLSVGYGDDFKKKGPCDNCDKDINTHRVEESVDSRGFALKLAGALARQEYNGLRYDKDSDQLDGYMIGVLICKGESKSIYAAMSGSIHDAFMKAVDTLSGWIPCGELVRVSIPNDQRAEFLKKARNPAHKKYRDSHPRTFPGLDLSDIPYRNPLGQTNLWASHQPHIEKAPLPGSCAAPRLIQRALQDGHVPGSMTEIWYSPSAPPDSPPQGKLIVKVDYWKDGQKVPGVFNHLETTPSCATCQKHLTCMLCGAKDASCP